MKKTLAFLAFCLSVLCCGAQVDTVLLRQANELFATGDYGESLTAFEKTLNQALKGGEKKEAARIYFSIGKIYGQLGKPLESLSSYQMAEKFADEAGDTLSKAKTLNNIGALYREQKNFSKALQYHAQASAIAHTINDSLTIADCANNTGIVYEMQNKFDTANIHYINALNIYKKINNVQRVSIALNNVGVMYKQMNNYPQAIAHYKEALAISESLGDKFVIAANNVNIASALIQTKAFSEALVYNGKGIDIARDIGALDILVAAADNMALAYAGLNNYPLAYSWQKKYTTYNDSLINIERNRQMADAEEKYQTAKKEKLIEQQKFQIIKRNYWLFGATGLLLLATLLGFSTYRRYKLRQGVKLQQAIIIQQDLATKAVLEAEENERKRIAAELHDGVGQMMSAAHMNLSAFEHDLQLTDGASKVKFDKIKALVDDSCKEVRLVSHQMMPNALLKNGLAIAVRDFVDKIDSRIIKVDLYSEGLNEGIDTNTEAVLYRVIQECVNNVIKHSGANHLDISLVKEDKALSVTIEDNGKGFDSAAGENKEGIGLKNIRARVHYLKGEVEIDSRPGSGTLVAIFVPVG